MNEQDVLIIDLLNADPNKGIKLLWEEYGERLHWAIRAKVVEKADVDDVFQNVLIKVLKGIHTFKGESALYTWLHRIAFNESMNHLVKQQKTTKRDSAGYNENMTSEHTIDADAIVVLLDKAMKDLPDRQKQVFMMRYYEDMKYEEISEALGVSVGGLKATYHLAVKKIEGYVTKNQF